MVGTDIIRNIIQDCEQVVKSGDSDSSVLIESISSIQSCLADISNTNSFMIMAINRCIDFTKASKGLKLVPKFETFNLQDALKLPIMCMKNIQNKIIINMNPIPAVISAFIITDKQWLQENVLCLLSNAAKYSTGGEVDITLSLIESEENEPLMNEIRPAVRSARLTTVGGTRRVAPSVTPTMRHENDYASAGRFLFPESTKVGVMSDSDVDMEAPNLTQKTFEIDDNKRWFSSSTKAPVDSPHNETTVKPVQSHRLSVVASLNDKQSGQVTSFIKIEIEDNGIGVPEDAMRELFNPFKQAQRLAGGTGLGLYSLAKRVEALSGKYGVSRRKDGRHGSLFWFAIPYKPDVYAEINSQVYNSTIRSFQGRVPSIQGAGSSPAKSSSSSHQSFISGKSSSHVSGKQPIVDRNDALHRSMDESPAVKDPSARNPASFQSPTPGVIDPLTMLSGTHLGRLHAIGSSKRSLNILVVDDSAPIVKMTTVMLKRQGHKVSSAENGAVAVDMILETLHCVDGSLRVFDIVLMDLQMPVMDGLEAVRRVREEEKRMGEETAGGVGEDKAVWRNRIIGVSACSDNETIESAFSVGIDAFIPKPFNMEAFDRISGKLLASCDQQQQTITASDDQTVVNA